MQDFVTIPAACPQCAQSLRVPGQNLSSAVRCPRCRSVLALTDIVSRETPILPAWTLSPVNALPGRGLTSTVDGTATHKEIRVVFADGTTPITDDVDAGASSSVTLADVLPRAPEPPVPLSRHRIARKDFGRRIVQALKSGASAYREPRRNARIARAATNVANRLASLDALLHPRATLLLLSMAALSVAAMSAESLGLASGLGAAVGSVFVALSLVMAVARTATIRDDDEGFSLRALVAAANARRHALEADARGFFSSPGTQQRASVGRFAFGWGLVALLALNAANVAEAMLRVLVGSEAAHDVDVFIGGPALGIMGLGALLRWLAARGNKPLAIDRAEDSLEPFFRARAPILGRSEAIAAARRSSGRGGEILASVAAWRPVREQTGQAYAKHLAHHLRRHVGSVAVEPAEQLIDAYGTVRNALVVGGSLLVVVRRRAHADGDRALRGVRRVRALWRNKPVLVVFVESPAGQPGKEAEPVERQLGRALDALMKNDPRVVGVWLSDT